MELVYELLQRALLFRRPAQLQKHVLHHEVVVHVAVIVHVALFVVFVDFAASAALKHDPVVIIHSLGDASGFRSAWSILRLSSPAEEEACQSAKVEEGHFQFAQHGFSLENECDSRGIQEDINGQKTAEDPAVI
jgi:hypothetical protein